jgi:hypothetical protein
MDSPKGSPRASEYVNWFQEIETIREQDPGGKPRASTSFSISSTTAKKAVLFVVIFH